MVTKFCTFFRSTIFLKALVALTGLVMILFLLGHLLGNLQIFAGAGPTPETTKINEYAALLKSEPLLLWGVRIILLLNVTLHILVTIALTRKNRLARPISYQVRRSYASPASRMMIYGGLVILFYLIYHILHFTIGSVHKDLFVQHDVYANMVRSFQEPLIVTVYIVAQVALFGHLYHGTLSLFRTLGVSHPRYLRLVKSAGIGLATIICLGFVSIPLGIFLGWVS